MLKRLLSRVRPNRDLSRNLSTARRASSGSLVEPLEGRQLLSTTLRVTSISADNRGEVVLTMNRSVKASSVTGSSVIIYLPGPDRKIGTADDVRFHAAVTYDPTTLKITIHGRLDLSLTGDLGYRVRVISSKLLASNGTELDGDFNGAGLETGNGKAGGNLDFKVIAPKGNPTARFSTTLGTIKVALFQNKVAATVNNFIAYINRAFDDNTIIHRSQPNDVIQGGGYTTALDGNGLPSPIVTYLPIKLQAKIDNTAGTLAMARTNDPDSATSQWFFNAVDNTSGPNNLDPHPAEGSLPASAGFAVFGQADTAGLVVIKAINNLTTVDLTPTVSPTAFETVPETNGNFVVIRRVALIDTIAAV